MRTGILKALKKSGGYVSGQALCGEFSVSRTAVWKAVEALKSAGYEIESVPRKGYRLLSSPDILTAEEILSEEAGSTRFLQRVEAFSEIDSTNEQVKRLAADGAPEGTLVVAEQQSTGKGRKGRNFLSPPGVGIFMSMLLRPKVRVEDASRITLISALAVQEGIFNATGLNCQIKWPNDIISGKRKLTGILTEMSLEEERISYLVVGIGINVNHTSFPEELKDIATSIRMETGKSIRRAPLLVRVAESFEKYYEIYEKTGDLSALKDRYNELLVNRDREVEVLDETHPYTGISEGINEKGELMVRTREGVKQVSFGEVSVRGIYGYV